MSFVSKASWKIRTAVISALNHIPGFNSGDRFYCNLCGQHSSFFLSYGHRSEASESFHLIGSGVRKYCECPKCLSHDRFRWVYEVLVRYTDIPNKPCHVLHIAAEPGVRKAICEKYPSCTYVTGDLEKKYSDIKIDVTNMEGYADNSVDVFIMNHVLEHIPDEAAAINEIKRVLKPDGQLVISFPMCLDRKTFEDPSITTPQGRLAAFGQEDHVRLYGTDSRERLESYGLKVRPLVAQECLGEKDVERMALIPQDTIFLCTL